MGTTERFVEMGKNSLVKQAEENVVKQAKAFEDILKITDALENVGNRICHEHIARNKFFEGLSIMREALYAEHSNAIRKCFLFVGVGGASATEYSRQVFKRTFGGDYEIMSFLDRWGQLPSFVKTEERERFQEELDETIKQKGL